MKITHIMYMIMMIIKKLSTSPFYVYDALYVCTETFDILLYNYSVSDINFLNNYIFFLCNLLAKEIDIFILNEKVSFALRTKPEPLAWVLVVLFLTVRHPRCLGSGVRNDTQKYNE